MSKPQGVFFGLSVEGVDSPVLAIVTRTHGALTLHDVLSLGDLCELPRHLRSWVSSDVECALCTDAPVTLDFAPPRGERRIDGLYRKLFPQEYEESQWVSRLPAVRAASMRALQGVRFAHELGLRIAETHPRASLAWLGARDARWQRLVGEYSGRRIASRDGALVPEGIVRERCVDLWNGLLSRFQIEDARRERFRPEDLELDATVCAIAASALTDPSIPSAIFPWSPNDCLIGAQGNYVVLGRGGKASPSEASETQLSSTPINPKRAA
jgi:hypothetical protein